ncbi:LLM class flavin-dependent oxidoreductase [Gordonia sp. TBRC 11910]|uniref:LLM class flavin-dependent oxidoreductase n=1 Tax=Gordonia asplenii TaxID=2725283 RepID=A0A848L334_9ACTN|nr:LLM class flavin-dependent oxidoreductase [Gordonia asplenii]NMO02971.1 LLM class flavin-dependent oxidoreductase [Gordonia asplenii]
MRLSTCILPVFDAAETRTRWREAEQLGFTSAYTYDHQSWRMFRDKPWYDALLTLSLGASVTTGLRLGTLVTTPNFRHPVTLAKDLITLDAISDGRITLGLGAGTASFDADVLGDPPLTPRRRQDRLEEFTRDLDQLLTNDAVSFAGEWYTAVEARTIPGCVQRPRIPFAIAGGGPRGMRLAAELGQAWVCDLSIFDAGDDVPAELLNQLERLGNTLRDAGRAPESLERILLVGLDAPAFSHDVDALIGAAGEYAAAGFTEIVIHAPIHDVGLGTRPSVYAQADRIAREIAEL